MTLDEKYIKKCILLSAQSLAEGELPFGSLIVKDEKIISQSANKTKNFDVTQHAEIVVMRKAQKKLKRKNFSDCIIYSSVEPCPMCAFMIRELRFKKVVFSLRSPVMGGYSRFQVLQDTQLNTQLKKFYGEPPEVIMGLLNAEANLVWEQWRTVHGFPFLQHKRIR